MTDVLARARRKAEAVFKELRGKHPTMKAHLVFWNRLGQAPIGADLAETMRAFPEICVEGDAARRAHALARDLADEKDPARRAAIERQLGSLDPLLAVRPDVQVEIRFDSLDYALLAKLRQDALVDKVLTPPTNASIRVVMGSVAELAGDD